MDDDPPSLQLAAFENAASRRGGLALAIAMGLNALVFLRLVGSFWHE